MRCGVGGPWPPTPGAAACRGDDSKVPPPGPGTLALLARDVGSRGSLDGTGAAARFAYPRGVAVDTTDIVHVADVHDHAIRRITPAGVAGTVVGVAGQQDGFRPGVRPGGLRSPQGVAVMGHVRLIATGHGVALATLP